MRPQRRPLDFSAACLNTRVRTFVCVRAWTQDCKRICECACMYVCMFAHCIPYRLGFSPQPQKNILVSQSRINPAPWKYLIHANPAQEFLPDRLRNAQKIPVFQSRTPKIERYFSCAQSPRRAKNDIFAR